MVEAMQPDSRNGEPSASMINDAPKTRTRLKKIPPYWYPYRTMAKGRWFDREILEMVSTEFRDRSVEYYRYALESGVTTVNGKIAKPGTIIRNGDRIENIVHRHEPPVTSTPVRILQYDKEREFAVIDKPGSIPVHATGRYFKNSLVEILKDDFGFKNVHTVNRLDRLTSGLMIIATSAARARMLTEEFTAGTIRKEYVARVKGKFPEGQVRCNQPLLTIDRQMGLNIVHHEGKNAETIFERMFYDEGTDTSIVHCRPLTGRSHQIRVHLQFLGCPIANDPVYSDEKIWGPNLGKGGIDLTPSDERCAPVPPQQFEASEAEGRYREVEATRGGCGGSHDAAQAESTQNRASPRPKVLPPPAVQQLKPKPKKNKSSPAWRTKEESAALVAALHAQLSLSDPNLNSAVDPETNTNANTGAQEGSNLNQNSVAKRLLPRETGHDIGMGSPVPLSKEAVDVIRKLRNQKDEDEDWSRWRDVVFKSKGALNPTHLAVPNLPPQNRRRRGGDVDADVDDVLDPVEGVLSDPGGSDTSLSDGDHRDAPQRMSDAITSLSGSVPVVVETSLLNGSDNTVAATSNTSTDEPTYCPECYLPLHPDPKPEKLYIFLHALRYTTSFGAFETSMPEWAERGWVWDRDESAVLSETSV